MMSSNMLTHHCNEIAPLLGTVNGILHSGRNEMTHSGHVILGVQHPEERVEFP